jgi:hypothetical protein
MRLRAEITTELLSRIIQILNACGSDVIVRFSPEILSFHVVATETQIGVWVGCPNSCCFNKFDVASRTENQIYLKTNLSQLALSVVLNQASIQMVLGQQNATSYLQFTHKALDSLRQLEHKVPIVILTQAIFTQYAEPEWPQPTMRAKFPSLRSVTTWCTNAKVISQLLLISILKDPETGQVDVVFKVENDVVTVSTRFTDLGISGQDGFDGEMVDQCDILLDMKKFLRILKVNIVTPTISILYIYDKKKIRMNFHAQVGAAATSFTYELPATSR